MAAPPLRILVVVGSLNSASVTRQLMHYVAERLRHDQCDVDILDFEKEPLALYNPETAHDLPGYKALQARVENSDVIVLGTPDYHGSISGATKNFLDHFWHEFAGKLFVSIVSSHEKGLTVTDQLRTIARQCYAWTLPYGVSFSEGGDFQDGKIVNESFQRRIDMLVRDAQVYGRLLSTQRRVDLTSSDPCFLAKLRS